MSSDYPKKWKITQAIASKIREEIEKIFQANPFFSYIRFLDISDINQKFDGLFHFEVKSEDSELRFDLEYIHVTNSIIVDLSKFSHQYENRKEIFDNLFHIALKPPIYAVADIDSLVLDLSVMILDYFDHLKVKKLLKLESEQECESRSG
jgi:hypothetical protein